MPLIWPWETRVVVPARALVDVQQLSVSPLDQLLVGSKKTFEPSLEAPLKKASKAPLPFIWPCETRVVVPAERS